MCRIVHIVKYIILLDAILYVEMLTEDLIITPNYRRFYVKIMNFHQKDYVYLETGQCCGGYPPVYDKCSTPCSRYAQITLQDQVSFKRDLQEENFEPLGIFLMDVLIYNDTYPIVFKSPLKFKLEIFDNVDNKIILSSVIENILLSPNSEKSWSHEKFSDGNFYDAFMSIRCDGYVGYNCQYRCDYTNPNIDCEFTTGKIMCKNGKRNPPDCTQDTRTCNPSPCLNGGICELTIDSKNVVCHCTEKFEGLYCQSEILVHNCDEDNTATVQNNRCICKDGFTGLECQIAVCNHYSKCGNNGACIIEDNIHHCHCNSNNYAGSFCQYECIPECKFGGCYYNEIKNTTICICDNGYNGDVCDISVPLTVPESDADIYSPSVRIGIAVGVALGLLLYICLLIGAIAYFQHRYTVKNRSSDNSTFTLSNLAGKNAKGKKNNSNSRL